MISLTTIQQRVDQTIGILETLVGLPGSLNGGNAELAQCIGTLKNISEEINDYQALHPPAQFVQSTTKDANRLGESGLHNPDGSRREFVRSRPYSRTDGSSDDRDREHFALDL